MKSLNILFYLSLLCLFLFFAACAKTNYQNQATPMYSTIKLTDTAKVLINKKWMEVSVEVKELDLDSSEAINITNQFYKTDLDDLMIFAADGTYQFNEGKSKSREDSKQVYEKGNWYIEGGQLILIDRNSPTHYVIRQLSTESLVLKLPVKNEEYYYILTYRSE